MPSSRPRHSSTLRAIAVLASAGALVLALTGCIGAPAPSSVPTSVPSSSPEPIFASDEEALAAAEAAYREYLATIDTIAAEGFASFDALNSAVTPDHRGEVIASLESLRTAGLTPVGATTFDSASLVETVQTQDIADVSLYLCLDVSGVRVMDRSGADVTSSERDDRSPMQVQFESAAVGDPRLLVASEEPWNGDDFC